MDTKTPIPIDSAVTFGNLKCAVCSYPLTQGDMIVYTDAGWAHRFSTTCKRVLEFKAAGPTGPTAA